MKMESEKFDIIFKNKLQDFSVNPPDDIWMNIEKSFDPKKKRYIAAWSAIAASVAIFAIGISIWYFSKDKANSVSDTTQYLTVNDNNIRNENITKNPVDVTPNIASGNDSTVISNRTVRISKNEKRNIEIYALKDNVKEVDDKITEKPQINAEMNESGIGYLSNINIKGLDTQQNNYQLVSDHENKNYIVDNTIKENKSKFIKDIAVGGYYSPVFSYRNNGSNNAGSSETPLLSSGGGLYVEFKLNDKLYFKTGLNLLKIGNHENSIWIRTSSYGAQWDGLYNSNVISADKTGEVSYVIIDNSIGNIDLYDDVVLDGVTNQFIVVTESNSMHPNEDPQTGQAVIFQNLRDESTTYNSAVYQKLDITMIKKFSVIEIPFLIRYKFINAKKLSVNVTSGLSANIITRCLVYNKYENRLIGETNGFNVLNASSTLGFGFEYPFSKRVSFSLEPTLKYFINSINRDGDVKVHPYSFGVYSGLRYDF